VTSHVRYQPFPRRYRFITAERFLIATGILRPNEGEIGNAFVRLTPGGILIIAASYAWDGASGPIAQTPDVIRGSLVHDALYQLMREGLLEGGWRRMADMLLREMCVTDGMPRWQAEMVHAAVSSFGSLYAAPEEPKPVLVAPVPVTYPSTADWIAP
jgi:hypothetical protein